MKFGTAGSLSASISCSFASKKRTAFHAALVFVWLGGQAASIYAQLTATPTSKQSATQSVNHERVSFTQVPLRFEPNRGQDRSDALFVSQGRGYALRLEPTAARIELQARADTKNSVLHGKAILTLSLDGADRAAHIAASERLAAVHSYFPSGDPATWKTGIPTYGRVNYEGIYRDIDLAFYGNESRLEYDFILHPNAKPGAIKLKLEGVENASVNKNGDLILNVDSRSMTLLKPVAYQVSTVSGERELVRVQYALRPADSRRHTAATLRFALGTYDHARALVIDPVMLYGLNIPGAPGYSYPPYYYPDTMIRAMSVDPQGNTYVAATVSSSNGNNCVMKFDPSGKLLYNVTFGSDNVETNLTAIAFDASGDIFVAGSAASGFPVTASAFKSTLGASAYESGFLTVIKSDASALLYSSYLDGSAGSVINGLAVDIAGKAYLTGDSRSEDFPITPGAYQTTVSQNSEGSGFVAKLDPSASGQASLIYSTYLAALGTNSDTSSGRGIVIDLTGDAYVIEQATADFPVTKGAYSPPGSTGGGIYIAKLNATGTGLIYSAYLGPGTPTGIAIDGAKEVYVTGNPGLGDFPTTVGAYQTAYPGGFAAKLSTDGATLLYSTFLGGPSSYSGSNVTPESIAITPGCAYLCNAYIAGITSTSDFPIKNAIQSLPRAGPQPNGYATPTGFLVNLADDGKSAAYSTYFGSLYSASYSQVVAADSVGNIYLGTNIQGPDAPATYPGVLYPGEGFIAKIGPANAAAVVATPSKFEFQSEAAVHSVLNATNGVELRNMGSLAATLKRPFITSGNEFAVTDNCGSEIAAGGSCALNLSFTPAAAGTRIATLTVPSSAGNSPTTVALTGYGYDGPHLIASTNSLSFIDRVVDTVSGTLTTTLTNTGNQSQPIIAIASSLPDYLLTSTCPPSLPAGASCKVSVQFKPTQIGLRSADLFVQFTISQTYSGILIPLSGTGVTTASGTGSLILSESVINFGSVLEGQIGQSQGVVLTNSGSAPVTVNAISATTNAGQGASGDFFIESPYQGNGAGRCSYVYYNLPAAFPFVLEPQSSCVIAVEFEPSTGGQESGKLSVSDSAYGGLHTVALSGSGLYSAQPLTISPSTLAFPAQPIGEPSAEQTFNITNGGEDFVVIDRATTTGDFGVTLGQSGNCEGTILGPQSSCGVSVVFNPTAAGTRSGTLTLFDTLSSTAQVFNLVGTGIQATGALILGQGSLAFPSQTKGTTSLGLNISVSNPGNSPVTINYLSTTGDFAASSQYAYSPDCGGVLAPDSTCLIPVVFSPTATGARTGTLTVHSTVGNQVVGLSGTSIAASQSINLTPAIANYGNLKVGTGVSQYNVVTIYINNTGNDPVTFSTPPVITGIAPAPSTDFQIAQGGTCSDYGYVPSNSYNNPVPLPPGKSCVIEVTFTPSRLALDQATMTFTDTAGTQSITLRGTGTANAAGEALEPSTLSFQQQVLQTSSNTSNYGDPQVAFTNYMASSIKINSITVTAGSSDFSVPQTYCLGASIYPSSSCSFAIDFKPSVLGYRTGAVTVKDSNGNTYVSSLAGYSIAATRAAALTPQKLLLPSASPLSPPTGGTYASSTLVLTNTGNTPLTVGTVSGTDFSRTIPATTDFVAGSDSCSGTTLAAGTQCNIYVTFTPKATGAKSGTVVLPLTYSDGSTSSLTSTLTATGLAISDSATFLPQNVTFPNEVVYPLNTNYPNQRQLVVQNTGTVALKVGTLVAKNLTGTAGVGGDFTYYTYYNGDGCSGQTINPGQGCTINIDFQPLTPGAKTGSATFPLTYADGKIGSVIATLTGTGIAPAPALQVTPSSLNFNVELAGTQDINNTQLVTLTNTGNADVEITSMFVSNSYFKPDSSYCGTKIPAGSVCTLTLAFSPPASAAPGIATATLNIVDNAPGSPHKVSLTGTVVTVAQQLALSQTSVSFASQTVSTVSAPQVVYLTYLGSSDQLPYGNTPSRVQINSIKLGGPNASDFTMSQNCGGDLGFTLTGRQYCALTVAFAPGATSMGTRTAAVTITPAQGLPLAIQLVGTGVAPARATAILPSSSLFPVLRPGTISATQTFDIRNKSSAPLSIEQVLTTMPSEFDVVADKCSHKMVAMGPACAGT